MRLGQLIAAAGLVVGTWVLSLGSACASTVMYDLSLIHIFLPVADQTLKVQPQAGRVVGLRRQREQLIQAGYGLGITPETVSYTHLRNNFRKSHFIGHAQVMHAAKGLLPA